MGHPQLSEVDCLLAPLATKLAHRADELLDLRECARSRTEAGRCLKCYFRLYEQASSEAQLKPLRDWLEKNIEVVASDEEKKMLERLPLSLEERELEALCWRFIHEFRDNRAYYSPHIYLEFRYKQAA